MSKTKLRSGSNIPSFSPCSLALLLFLLFNPPPSEAKRRLREGDFHSFYGHFQNLIFLAEVKQAPARNKNTERTYKDLKNTERETETDRRVVSSWSPGRLDFRAGSSKSESVNSWRSLELLASVGEALWISYFLYRRRETRKIENHEEEEEEQRGRRRREEGTTSGDGEEEHGRKEGRKTNSAQNDRKDDNSTRNCTNDASVTGGVGSRKRSTGHLDRRGRPVTRPVPI